MTTMLLQVTSNYAFIGISPHA